MQNMVHILYLYSLASCMYDSDFHAWEQGEGGGYTMRVGSTINSAAHQKISSLTYLYKVYVVMETCKHLTIIHGGKRHVYGSV